VIDRPTCHQLRILQCVRLSRLSAGFRNSNELKIIAISTVAAAVYRRRQLTPTVVYSTTGIRQSRGIFTKV